jgi:hypothetical protein
MVLLPPFQYSSIPIFRVQYSTFLVRPARRVRLPPSPEGRSFGGGAWQAGIRYSKTAGNTLLFPAVGVQSFNIAHKVAMLYHDRLLILMDMG